MKRVVAYIDGFNLYYGLRASRLKRFYWLNLQRLAKCFLRPGQALVETKYFTAIVKQPDDKRLRQQVFLDALQTLPDLFVYYGHYLSETVTCRNCGFTYTTHHEKMTDVNISVELLKDAFQDKFDIALLVSADSDLVGPVRAIQQSFPGKKVIPVFPPGRSSAALKAVSSAVLHIGINELSKSRFPDQVNKNGTILTRPSAWH